MKDSNDPFGNRRRFLKACAIGAAVAPFAAISTARADKERITEDNPAAVALDYVHDAADASDHPKWEEGQTCGNCRLYTDKGDGWGDCTIFPQYLVAEPGWCNVWEPMD